MYFNGLKPNYLFRYLPPLQKGLQLRSKCGCTSNCSFAKDKVAIITGGADGIGLECAKELLRSGLRGLVIGDIAKEKECMETLTKEFDCCKIIFKTCDVTNKCQLVELFKAAKDKWCCLDILLNNAGILNDSEWEHEIATNITALVRGTYLGLEHMGRDNGGCGGVIINFSSVLGLQQAAGTPVYVGTKHFVIGFDRSIGECYHYSRTGVRVLTICPGVTLTSMIHSAAERADKQITPEMGELLTKELAALPPQGADCVAKGITIMLEKGKSGSIWVSEGNEFYEVNIPNRQSFRICDCKCK